MLLQYLSFLWLLPVDFLLELNIAAIQLFLYLKISNFYVKKKSHEHVTLLHHVCVHKLRFTLFLEED